MNSPGPPTRVSFVVPGEPRPAARPQVMRRIAVKAPADVQAQALVGVTFRAALAGRAWPLEPERGYDLHATFLRGTYRAGDVDNLLKTVLDGLNRVAYHDDRQVINVGATVQYGPRRSGGTGLTVVRITRLPQDWKGNPLPLSFPTPTR